GMVVVNVLQPGTGLTIDPASIDMKTVSTYTAASKGLTTVDFILNIIPTTVFDAFTRGEILQVLLFSVLFGLAALSIGKTVAPLVAARSGRKDAVRHRGYHHAARADRRLRRDGVHGRPLRHRVADLARAAHGRHVCHLPAVRLHRAGRHRTGRRVPNS